MKFAAIVLSVASVLGCASAAPVKARSPASIYVSAGGRLEVQIMDVWVYPSQAAIHYSDIRDCSTVNVECVFFGYPLAVDLERLSREESYSVGGYTFQPNCLEDQISASCSVFSVKFSEHWDERPDYGGDSGFFIYEREVGIIAFGRVTDEAAAPGNAKTIVRGIWTYRSGPPLLGPEWQRVMKPNLGKMDPSALTTRPSRTLS